jgi:predicted anti-sigma-YlaC factor YlaD
MDRRLTWTERTRVWVHLKVCSACSNFTRQMKLLRSAMRQLTIPETIDGDGEKK